MPYKKEKISNILRKYDTVLTYKSDRCIYIYIYIYIYTERETEREREREREEERERDLKEYMNKLKYSKEESRKNKNIRKMNKWANFFFFFFERWRIF